jgi:hypothetical protein
LAQVLLSFKLQLLIKHPPIPLVLTLLSPVFGLLPLIHLALVRLRLMLRTFLQHPPVPLARILMSLEQNQRPTSLAVEELMLLAFSAMIHH